MEKYKKNVASNDAEGNKVEEEVTKVMGGGVILESPAWKLRNETRAEVLAEVQEVLAEKDEKLMEKDEQLMEKDEQLTARDEQILAQKNQMAMMEQRNAELEAMVRSLGGKP